jgi:hypothetical protein
VPAVPPNLEGADTLFQEMMKRQIPEKDRT